MNHVLLPLELFDYFSDGLAIYDTNGQIACANKEFTRLSAPKEDQQAPCQELKELVKKFQDSKACLVSKSISLVSARIDINASLCAIEDGKKQIGTLVLIKKDRKTQNSTYALAEHMFNAYLNKKQLNDMQLAPELQVLKGDDRQFRMALHGAQKAAVSEFPIMIRGDSGTGKELLARAIHSMSPYSQGPFVDINCSAIPDSLIESELFGYEKGAFTSANKGGKPGLFEKANQGSIFLDEIGDISLSAQAKILRVLEEKTFRRVGGTKNINVDVRIISATNRDLEQMIAERLFREDLYYRLNSISIMLPPLHKRGRDIRTLADHLLQKAIKGRQESSKNKDYSLSEETLQVLEKYPWPGNVRELRGVIEYAVVMCDDTEITPQSLPSFVLLHQSSVSEPQMLISKISEDGSIDLPLLPTILKDVEKNVMKAALNKAKNKTEAMKSLGISRRAFYYKLKEYDLEKDNE
jgi:transcriptional regulator with PAS, ATPase and Fis domain